MQGSTVWLAGNEDRQMPHYMSLWLTNFCCRSKTDCLVRPPRLWRLTSGTAFDLGVLGVWG